MSDSAGQIREMFALMKDDKLVMIVAKHPNKPEVTDITEDLARLLHWKFTAPPTVSEPAPISVSSTESKSNG